MSGHRQKAEDGPPESGGCLNPLQQAEHVPLPTVSSPRLSVHRPSDTARYRESNRWPQLQGRVWCNSWAYSR